jgi:diguanylate cyclase (GGDEF)-like protein/PAS domain S-box-containing protein
MACVSNLSFRQVTVRLWPSSKWLAWLVLGAGLVLTFLQQQAAWQDMQHNQQVHFAAQNREITLRIEQRLGAYEQVLHGARGLFIASDHVTREAFGRYVASLRLASHYPGIQGIGFSPRLLAADKAAHVAAVRRQGLADYSIRPEGERPLYAPVLFLEPFSGRNLRALGFDVYAEPVRRAAMEQARDTDRATLSGKLVLAQDAGDTERAGFLMYLPVYRQGQAHDTLTGRRASLLGWVSAPFRMDDLMRGILGEQVTQIDLEIFDGETASADTLMYDSDRQLSLLQATPAHLQFSQRLQVGGHVWQIHLRSLPASNAMADSRHVTALRLGGTLMSVLLALLVWQLTTARARALRLAQDMTQELRLQTTALQDTQVRLKTLFDTLPDLVWLKDLHGVYMACNPRVESLFGATEADILGKTDDDFVDPLLAEAFRANDRAALAAGGPQVNEEWVTFASDGHRELLETTKTPLLDAAGQVVGVLGLGHNITARHQIEEQVQQLAFYDPLTRLPNRRLLRDRLNQAMAASQRSQRYGAVIFLDLDNFKTLNDTHGHAAGDLLLIEVARRLTSCVREMDTVARIGGDEFVVILGQLETDEAHSNLDARSTAEKIRHALAEPYPLTITRDDASTQTITHHGSASMGVVLFLNHDCSQDNILKWADAAMYQAKAAGRNQVHVSTPAPGGPLTMLSNK